MRKCKGPSCDTFVSGATDYCENHRPALATKAEDGGVAIFCPGCGHGHMLWIEPKGNRPFWTFNGNFESPTFTPSLLVQSSDQWGPTVCHSFITNGQIRFLDDCTHKLKGQTVPLEPFDWIPDLDLDRRAPRA